MKNIAHLTAGIAAAALLATALPALADETLTQNATQTSSGTAVGTANSLHGSLVTNNAFQNASGNIGLNQADGNANEQGNMLYIDGGSNFAFTGTFSQSSTADSAGSLLSQNASTINDNAFRNAVGRIGVNQASGNLNKQLNAAVIADASGKTLSTSISQSMASATVVDMADSNKNLITDDAFRRASGDIGVNQASGNLNSQVNTLVVADDAALTVSSQSLLQTAAGSHITVAPAGVNTSTLSGNAFQYAQGNIGVNQAAGNGNLQTNTAVVLK